VEKFFFPCKGEEEGKNNDVVAVAVPVVVVVVGVSHMRVNKDGLKAPFT